VPLETPPVADTGPTCLVELVLSAGEFGPHAEPALKALRAALDGGPGDGQVLRTGVAVTQEFGKLDITLRAVVSAPDLVSGAALGTEHLRQAVAAVDRPGFQEQSVRASWT
jgi:hypothetical protein